MADVITLLQLASDELVKRAGTDSPSVPDIRVSYSDGHAPFTSIEQLANALPDADLAKVESISYSMLANNESGDWAFIKFGDRLGLIIAVHSSDRVWALGLTELLTELGQKGAQPQKSGERRPLKWWEWLCMSLLGAACAAEILLTAIGVIPSLATASFLLATVTLFMLPLVKVSDRGIDNPTLRLIAEDVPPPSDEKRSLSVRIQEAIRKRPILSVTLAFASAIAANLVSDLLGNL